MYLSHGLRCLFLSEALVLLPGDIAGLIEVRSYCNIENLDGGERWCPAGLVGRMVSEYVRNQSQLESLWVGVLASVPDG